MDKGDFRGTYSDAVELDHKGTVVAVRDIKRGEVITIPMHIFSKIGPKPKRSNPNAS
jgi:hypothetical protein